MKLFDRAVVHLESHRALYTVVVPVAVLVRSLYVNAHGFWFDESNSVHIARRFFEPGLFTRGLVGPESILWLGLVRVWLALSDAELWLKMMPLLLSVLSVVAAYYAARRFLGDSVRAVYVALMVAVSPFHVYYACELRTFALYALTGFTAFYYFARLLDNERDRTALVGYVLAVTATFYAHYIGLLWAVALGLAYAAAVWGDWRRIGRWLAVNTVVAAVCAPGLWCFLAAARLIYSGQWVLPRPGWKSPAITVKNMVVGFTAARPLYLAATVVAVILVLTAMVRTMRSRAYRRLIVLLITAGLMPATIFVLSYFGRASSYLDRYFTPAMLPLYMLFCIGAMGYGPEGMRRFRRTRIVFAAIPVAVMSAGIPSVWRDAIHPAIRHRPGVRYKIDNRAVAEYINAHLQTGDAIGHASHVTLQPMRYYLPEHAGKYVVLTEADRRGLVSSYPVREIWMKAGMYPERIERYLDETEAVRLWLVVSWWEPFAREDPPERMLAWCDGHLPMLDHAAFRGIDLYLYDTDIGGTARRAARILDGAGPVDVYPSGKTASRVTEPARVPRQHQGGWSSGTTVYFDQPPRQPMSAGQDTRVVVRPETDGVHTYQYVVYHTAQLVEAVSFVKEQPSSDLWRINVVYNPSPPPPRTFPDTCLSVALDKEMPAANDIVARELAVPPGSYDVFVRALLEGLARNEHRVALHVALDERKLPRFDCNIPGIEARWDWVRLGSAEIDGPGPHRVTMSVTNPGNLPVAYLDIDKLALVAAGTKSADLPTPGVAAPPVLAQGSVSATRDSPATIALPMNLSVDESGQIDVFVVDTATRHEYRLFFRLGTG